MRTIVFSLACLFALPGFASELAGATVPPYPGGMTSDMGSCIATGDDICAYSIASLNGRDGSVVAVMAEQLIRHIDGKAVWKIVDTQDAPEESEGQIWAFEECHVNGSVDPAAIGLVAYEDRGGWIEASDTIWAVKFDIPSKALVELDPATVRCVLPGS